MSQRTPDRLLQLIDFERLLQDRQFAPPFLDASRAVTGRKDEGHLGFQQELCRWVNKGPVEIDVENGQVEHVPRFQELQRFLQTGRFGYRLIAEGGEHVDGRQSHQKLVLDDQGLELVYSRLRHQMVCTGSRFKHQSLWPGKCFMKSGDKLIPAPREADLQVRQFAGRSFSTRLVLLALGTAIILPLLLFAVILSFRYAQYESGRAEQLARQLASNIGLVVDAELDRRLGILRGLAASQALATGDYARFDAEARRALPDSETIILLRDLGERQILNTQVPYGRPLPPAIALSAKELDVFRAGRPYVSDVYKSPITGETRYAVAMPISLNGGVAFLLSLTAPATRIRDLLIMATPPGWVSAVGDRKGTYIARSERHDEVTGRPGAKPYLEKAVGRSGAFWSTNLWGTPLLAGYFNSELSGWLIAANVPEAVVFAPFRRSLLMIGLAGASALAFSILGAYLIGRSFTAATARLTHQARALGEGRTVAPFRTRMSDLGLVGDALASASAAINRREKERELLINELNHRVKNTLATVQSIAMNTLKNPPLEEARQSFSSRLLALSRIHDILTQQNWSGAELKDIIADLRSGFGGDERIEASGPGIWLPPNVAMAMSLTLNELATNAAKYGALSGESGSVQIRWRVELREAAQMLIFDWQERHGPAVSPPTRKGFGLRLIESAFAGHGGKAEVNFGPEGLSCRIEIPAPVFRRSPDEAVGLYHGA